MKHVSISLIVAAVLLLTGFATPASAADVMAPPSGTEVERLLRDALKQPDSKPPALVGYRGASLLDFDMQRIDRIADNRWLVIAELFIDFGKPPAGVLGFESRRRGLYRMWVEHDGETWQLRRFAPIGTVRPLPGHA